MNDFLEYIEQPCLTKAHMATPLHADLGITQREAREIVDSFFSLIAESLARGEEVKIAGFGSFELRQKVARPGRNPRTGEPVLISGRKTVRFFASPKQKEMLQKPTAGVTAKAPRTRLG